MKKRIKKKWIVYIFKYKQIKWPNIYKVWCCCLYNINDRLKNARYRFKIWFEKFIEFKSNDIYKDENDLHSFLRERHKYIIWYNEIFFGCIKDIREFINTKGFISYNSNEKQY